MTKLELKGSGNESKGRLEQKYGSPTDDDRAFAQGKDEEQVGRKSEEIRDGVEDL